jgi:uncharacterized cupin superfamily protein
VLVDPVPFYDGDAAQIADLGGVAAVVVTLPDRAEAALRCRDEVGCPVLAVPGLPGLGDAQAQPLTTGSSLPAGLAAVALPAEAPPREADVAALFHAPSGSVLVSGAVAGVPAGALTLQGADDAQAAQVARRLRAVLAHPIRRVLVADGEPLLRDAEGAVQELVFKHDPAAFLLHADELVWQAPRGMGTRFLRRSGECSRLLGLRTLDFEVTVVPPGKQSTLMHSHAGYEELFVILEGEGEVQTERGTFPIRAGDALGFPARNHPAHGIRNTGSRDLRMLSFGADPPPDEAAGIAEYPEANKLSAWLGPGKLRRFYLPDRLDVDYWEGERLE